MTFAQNCNEIFDQTVKLYHVTDDVDAVFNNPFDEGSIEGRLARKNWIDAVQWHLEDIIRDEAIDPVAALALKRRIDRSNQDGQGRCHNQYRESCVGHRPPVDSRPQDLAHA